jgi:hypothetical protein
MSNITNREKFLILKTWTLQHIWTIPVSYIISLIVILLFCAIFDISMDEFGSQPEQLVMQIAGGTVLGIGTGLIQRLLLRQVFDVPQSWIWSLVTGFVLAEIIAGFICWRLNINRMELRFIELNALPESLIFALAGLLTGLLQWTILRKYFLRSFYWVFASMTGWGICILIMGFVSLFPSLNTLLTDVLVFMLGVTLYGAITGGTLIWVLQKREINRG